MRSCVIWLAAASLAFVAMSASGGEVEDQLLQMQQRLEQLGQQLDATSDELAAANAKVEQQQELIESSGVADARGSSSGLASFLETLEIGGWVAASYNYNFNDPDGGSTGGANTGGAGYPFHPDANTFSIDQLWFELEKPVSEDSRAGFRADLAFGKIADILTDGSGGSSDGLSGSDEDLELYQAYVQYLAPVGNGLHIKAGKFGTLFGAEVAQQPYNLNITRGQVYNLLQPITHTGVLATHESNGLSVSLGLTNDTTTIIDVDNNNNKNIIGGVGYAQDTWGLSLSGLWGAPNSSNERDKEMILDAILSFDPSENFSGYINATWRDVENGFTNGASPAARVACGKASTCGDTDAWGVAAAGRFAISDRTGFALRAEWVEDKDSVFSGLSTSTGGMDTEIITLTGTIDHMLTEQLMLRAEARYDEADVDGSGSGLDDVFTADGAAEDDQIVGAVELIYNF